MKKETHPTYYPKAEVSCVCGNTFTVGATKEKIEIEICSDCHPFYKGTDQLIDTAGRADRFKARREKAAKAPVRKKKEKKKTKAKAKATKKTKPNS